MNDELFEEIYQTATKLYRRHSNTIRGQIITPQDNFEYWLVLAAYNRGKDDGQDKELNS